MTEAIVLWGLALVAGVACALQIYGMRQTRCLTRVLEVQLTGMNEQYYRGDEALTLTLATLERRIKTLEDEVL